MTKYRPVKISELFSNLMTLEQMEVAKSHRYFMRFNDAQDLDTITKENLEAALGDIKTTINRLASSGELDV